MKMSKTFTSFVEYVKTTALITKSVFSGLLGNKFNLGDLDKI